MDDRHVDGRSAPPALPSCSSAATTGSVELAAKDYNPIRRMRELNLLPVDIFAEEPRDPVFGERAERLLRARFTARLQLRPGIVPPMDVTCRTGSCEVIMGQVPGKDPDVFLQALGLDSMADAMQVGPAENGTSIVLLFSDTQRDPKGFDGLMHRHEASDQ